MERDVAALQRRITELQQVLYHCREGYLQAQREKVAASERLQANATIKEHLEGILRQLVPKIKAGVWAIQQLHKDQLRSLRVLRQLPVDAQRAVEVMYIMLKCDAFEEVGQLQAVEFDENAYRMMLNMDEYLRKMEAFDTQLLADRPHVLQYLVETYFGGTPVHQNTALFGEESPSCHWGGEPLQHEDLLGIGRRHRDCTKMPPPRRHQVQTCASQVRRRSRFIDTPASEANAASRPSVTSLLPKPTRLPPIPTRSNSSVCQPLQPTPRPPRHSTAPAALAPRRPTKPAIEYVFVEGSEMPEDDTPEIIVWPLSVPNVLKHNRAIGTLFRWCISQLHYAEVLRSEGPVLEYHTDVCMREVALRAEIAALEATMAERNAERVELEAEIQGLLSQHHVQHLQLAHLLHDQALAPEDERKRRSAIQAEEMKAWGLLKERWDRHLRELRQRTKKLSAEEEKARNDLIAEQHAERRKVTELIHHKLRFILEFMSRRANAVAEQEPLPAVPLPWY